MLHVLIVEDMEDDALLLLRELKRGGYSVEWKRVDTANDFIAALESTTWDLVISDYSMPTFTGAEALKLLRARDPDMPFFLLSGAIGEDAAVEALKAGATDFFLKDKKARLIPAIERELRDAENRRRQRVAEIALQENEEQLRLAINAAQMGFIDWEIPTARFIYGGLCHKLFGVMADAMIPTYEGFLALICEADRNFVDQALSRALQGEFYQTEFRVILPEGATRWLNAQGQLYWRDNQPVRMSVVIHDITARKCAEEKLTIQAMELQARNEELDAFAYTVAHDLKNPIASMMGFASLIRNYYHRMSRETVLEHIDHIIEGGQQLRSIINALLLLAGVNKQETVEVMPIDMHNVVDDVQRRLAMMILEYDAKIHLPDDWLIGAGYPPWIEEVWMNYLSNALKYGGRPPEISMGSDRLSDGTIKFWMRDNGNGLTSEEQSRLFTPFTRLSHIKIEGHGLGLSVVQRIVTKLHGRVGVESTPGQGSTFYFTLPEWKGRY
ncbi:MAG: ATP-binding protein [Anaerolineae bacterium]|jgi:PAS domain S-box-containing protein|nr:ATP-binding protein [Anaerolineae bacterium]